MKDANRLNISHTIIIGDEEVEKKQVVSLKKNIKNSDVENLGAKFYDLFKDIKQNTYNLNSNTISEKSKNFVGNF